MISVLRNALAPSRQSSAQRRRSSYVPSFESLEERRLLSAGYVQTNLISDIPALARFTDPNLINPWGVSLGPGGSVQLANNDTGVVTAHDGDYPPVASGLPYITIPASNYQGYGKPTGIVFNSGGGFSVSEGGKSGPSLFLFATEEGTIAGWSPDVDLGHALVAVNQSGSGGYGAMYTGLALASSPDGTLLYAANFKSGAIDVFNQDFQLVHWSGAFSDPNLPAGFAPFNVQQIGTYLYVVYTRQTGGRYDGGAGPGNGIVDVFDTSGNFLRRAATQGPLDAPWGVALAPAGFGEFSNDLLVGNFADGRINAFDPETGAFLGAVQDTAGNPVVLPGLWALTFAQEGAGDDANALYVTAGIGNEQHGLFSVLQPASAGVNPPAQPSIASALAGVPQTGPAAEAGDDAYPLPPVEGPALHGASAQPAQVVVLLTTPDSALVVVPTLLTAGSAANGPTDPAIPGAGANVAVVGSTPAAASQVLVFSSGTLENAAPHPYRTAVEPAKVPGTDAAAGRNAMDANSSALQPEWTILESLLESRHAQPEFVEVADTRAILRTRHDGATERGVQSGAIVTQQTQPPHAIAAREETQTAGPSAAAMPPERGSPRTSRLQSLYHFLLLMLAGYGIRLTWHRHPFSRPATFKKIKSLWWRLTPQPSKTIVIDPEELLRHARTKTNVA